MEMTLENFGILLLLGFYGVCVVSFYGVLLYSIVMGIKNVVVKYRTSKIDLQ